MKRFLLFGSLMALLITSCTGLASSTKNNELSELYGPVTIYAAPT
jgi:hypothetical protein